jgi:hypothetical protein
VTSLRPWAFQWSAFTILFIVDAMSLDSFHTACWERELNSCGMQITILPITKRISDEVSPLFSILCGYLLLYLVFSCRLWGSCS